MQQSGGQANPSSIFGGLERLLLKIDPPALSAQLSRRVVQLENPETEQRSRRWLLGHGQSLQVPQDYTPLISFRKFISGIKPFPDNDLVVQKYRGRNTAVFQTWSIERRLNLAQIRPLPATGGEVGIDERVSMHFDGDKRRCRL